MTYFLVPVVAVLALAAVGTVAAAEPAGADRPPAKRELVSIAVLTTAERKLDADEIRPRLAKRLGVEFGKSPDDANLVAQFRPNMVAVRVGGQRFGIMSADKPYAARDAAWVGTADPRIGGPFKRHEAWFAVDWFPTETDADRQAAYRRIGAIVAELIGDDCLLLFLPGGNKLAWIHDDTRRRLTSDEPLSALDWPDPAIVFVPPTDPRMVAAVAEARRRFPEFARAFAARAAADHYAVKAEFKDAEGAGAAGEFMWVHVESITDGVVRGRLNNRPAAVTSVKLGDPVEVRLDQLNDWLIVRGGKPEGGFTIKVLEAAQREAATRPATNPAK